MSYLRFFNRQNRKENTLIEPEAYSLEEDSSEENNRTYDDLGFGGRLNSTAARFINDDGQFNVIRQGGYSFHFYQWLVTTSWMNFFLLIIAFYIISNALFAVMFVMCGMESLSGVESGNWLENFANGFFFSVQTFTTVGYGSISPVGWEANILASFNALFGLMSFALATGLFFARFARPSAKIRFSEKVLIAPYQEEINGLMFRIVNLRESQLRDVHVQVALTWLCSDKHGNIRRKFQRLELERQRIAMFPLNWTVVHPINENSPIYQKAEKDLIDMDIEVIAIVKAFDDTFAQYVNTTRSYKPHQMVVGAKFLPMYHVNDEGQTVLELEKVDDIEEVEL